MEYWVLVGLKKYKVSADNAPIAKGIAIGRHRVKYPSSTSSAVIYKWRKNKRDKWH